MTHPERPTAQEIHLGQDFDPFEGSIYDSPKEHLIEEIGNVKFYLRSTDYAKALPVYREHPFLALPHGLLDFRRIFILRSDYMIPVRDNKYDFAALGIEKSLPEDWDPKIKTYPFDVYVKFPSHHTVFVSHPGIADTGATDNYNPDTAFWDRFRFLEESGGKPYLDTKWSQKEAKMMKNPDFSGCTLFLPYDRSKGQLIEPIRLQFNRA